MKYKTFTAGLFIMKKMESTSVSDKKDCSNKLCYTHILKYYVAIKGNAYEEFFNILGKCLCDNVM
jgi:hypothetical protein